ncbi:UNVERIFIED_CONTAM: hypothetical protein HDU68_004431 [Siphonaria sp. JEL0065]|nr:hypothetical protein HDU68_004431 [Siphonaria sp. JEL0065]
MVSVPKLAPTTAVFPSRKEVRTFFADPKQSSLFLQAFAVLQARDPKDPKSYAQVSSIHGLPNTDYDGFPQEKPNGGYCVHGQSLFPTWHRPYIALIEVLIIEAAKDIAKKYTVDTQSWLTAAANIRFPYWDWANDASITQGIPSILVDENVAILATPDAHQATIKNPLASFAIPSVLRESFPGNFKTWNRTLRFPKSADPNATSDVLALQQKFKAAAPNLRSMVRVLFDGTVVKWQDFSNHSLDFSHQQPGNYHSLEFIHDQIHVIIAGNGGHMGSPDVAAYDPIFYFHHCNVDRLLALYEHVFDLYVDDGKVAAKGLAPFKKAEGPNNTWNSNDTRETAYLGYSYPELSQKGASLQTSLLSIYGRATTQKPATAPVVAQPAVKVTGTRGIEIGANASAPAAENPAANAANAVFDGIQSLTKGISSLFGAAAPQPVANASTPRAIHPAAAPAAEHAHHTNPPTPAPSHPAPAATAAAAPHVSAYAHFQVKKNAINGPFTIKFFVDGKLGNEASVFARLRPDLCSNCVDYDDLTLGGAASLTDAFTAAGLLGHPDRWASAVKYEIVDGQGHHVSGSRVPSLKVYLRTAVERRTDSGVGNGTFSNRQWGQDLLHLHH